MIDNPFSDETFQNHLEVIKKNRNDYDSGFASGTKTLKGRQFDEDILRDRRNFDEDVLRDRRDFSENQRQFDSTLAIKALSGGGGGGDNSFGLDDAKSVTERNVQNENDIYNAIINYRDFYLEGNSWAKDALNATKEVKGTASVADVSRHTPDKGDINPYYTGTDASKLSEAQREALNWKNPLEKAILDAEKDFLGAPGSTYSPEQFYNAVMRASGKLAPNDPAIQAGGKHGWFGTTSAQKAGMGYYKNLFGDENKKGTTFILPDGTEYTL